MRYLASGFWILAGTMHFVVPRQYEAIVPAALQRWRGQLVQASGVAEIAGGAGVMLPPCRRAAAWWSIATLVAVFPANLHMALNHERYRNVPGGRPALLLRLPVQLLFIAWALAAGRSRAGSPRCPGTMLPFRTRDRRCPGWS